MRELDDITLLREYVEAGSEAAFAMLVERHVDRVYSVALRHAGNVHQAEEITQAVFVILAKKARSLRRGVILEGWLYQTARLTAVTQIRSEIRRAHRERKAFMQTTSNENEADAWSQMVPLLDGALGGLNERERNAVVLRFFYGKSMREIGVVLDASEDSARMRIQRALEKLRQYFFKRGVTSTTAMISRAMTTNSVQAAPVALAKMATAAALAKGAGATLTIAKGALKIMAWIKVKTATVVFVGALLAVGTTSIAMKEIQEHRTYPWEVRRFNLELLDKMPPQVRLVPSKFPPGGMGMNADGKFMGIGQPLSSIFPHAYKVNWSRTLCEVQLPTGKYDFIANLPSGSAEAMQREIERKLGVKTKHEMRETDALLLTVRNANAPGLKPATSGALQLREDSDNFIGTSCSVSDLCSFLESNFQVPVIDGTALTQRFDINFKWDLNDPQHESLKRELRNQLGLELAPSREQVEMLVVEKAR